MKHISLFSGIGGFDLAAQWMGWENVAHCEWNPFGQRILKYYWPNAISYEDITKTDFSVHRGTIDIVTGGFPCQPYSATGQRKGTEDDRHLWPEMLRAIREIQPSWVVGENVRGLTNWNGGMVFDEVQHDLENEGYKVTPFLLPAASVGAPHERYRIWFIAYSYNNSNRSSRKSGKIKSNRCQNNDESGSWRKEAEQHIGCDNVLWTNTNSSNIELQRSRKKGNAGEKRPNRKERKRIHPNTNFQPKWEKFPIEPPLCNGNDGISGELDGITFSKFRKESIKAGGNAIVPQLALQIFKAIEKYQQLNLEL